MKQQILSNKVQYFDKFPRLEFDYEGDELYPNDRYTLADILAFVKSKGWEDYSKITIGSTHHPKSSDTFVWIEASIPKTEAEIKKEEAAALAKEEKALQVKLARKEARERKAALKAKAVGKLSVEERKALGL